MRLSIPLIAAFAVMVRAAAVPRDAVVTRANDFGEWSFITYTTESVPVSESKSATPPFNTRAKALL